MTLAEIMTRVLVGIFIFWLIGGCIAMRWVFKWLDEGADE